MSRRRRESYSDDEDDGKVFTDFRNFKRCRPRPRVRSIGSKYVVVRMLIVTIPFIDLESYNYDTNIY